MSLRKIPFVNNEFYHIYNRGVDKRDIFSDQNDINRFFQSMKEFNSVESIGSLYLLSRDKAKSNCRGRVTTKLVEFVAYCLNPNHYHLILKQIVDNGISLFMKKLGGGFSYYFNERYDRSGALFQGRFKSTHIDSNEYMLHASAYVNLNNKVHKLNDSNLVASSWNEYIGDSTINFCNTDIVLGQFNSKEEYKKYAEEALEGILERRENDKEFEKLLLE